jgi:hypothetical protein
VYTCTIHTHGPGMRCGGLHRFMRRWSCCHEGLSIPPRTPQGKTCASGGALFGHGAESITAMRHAHHIALLSVILSRRGRLASPRTHPQLLLHELGAQGQRTLHTDSDSYKQSANVHSYHHRRLFSLSSPPEAVSEGYAARRPTDDSGGVWCNSSAGVRTDGLCVVSSRLCGCQRG